MGAAVHDRRPAVVGRSATRVVTGLAVAAVLALLTALLWANDPEPAPDADTGILRVGVVEGQSLTGYLEHTRGELTALPAAEPTWALISLIAYVEPDRLASVLNGTSVAEVYARAPLPGTATPVLRIPAYRVPEDVVAGMAAAAARRDQEQADYRRLGARVGDGNVVRLRRAYESAAATAAAEAHAYRRNCACVFAAVVRGDQAALHRLAARAEVRAVDPAPEVHRLDRVEFRPPLPEEQVAAPEPARSALPSPGPRPPAVAPVGPGPLPSSSGVAVTSDSPGGIGSRPGPVATASEDLTAVPATPAPSSPAPDVPSEPQGASRNASGR